MPTLEFPNPGIATTYVAPNGVTYEYDGEKWVIQGTGGSAGTSIENWIPVESTQPTLTDIEIEANSTTFTPVSNGVELTYNSNPSQVSTARSKYDIFTLDSSEQGIYGRWNSSGFNENPGNLIGYFGFTDRASNWYQFTAQSIMMELSFSAAIDRIIIRAESFDIETGEFISYESPPFSADLLDRDICFSVQGNGTDEITVNIYVSDLTTSGCTLNSSTNITGIVQVQLIGYV